MLLGPWYVVVDADWGQHGLVLGLPHAYVFLSFVKLSLQLLLRHYFGLVWLLDRLEMVLGDIHDISIHSCGRSLVNLRVNLLSVT